MLISVITATCKKGGTSRFTDEETEAQRKGNVLPRVTQWCRVFIDVLLLSNKSLITCVWYWNTSPLPAGTMVIFVNSWHWGNAGRKGRLFFLALVCPLLIAPEGAKASTAKEYPVMSSCQQGPGVTFPCEQFYQHPDKFHCHGTPANSSTIQRVAACSLWLSLDPSGTIKWRGGCSRSVLPCMES